MISALAAHEGPLFKGLRLGALRESPDSFAPLAAASEHEPDEYWQRAARRFAVNDDAQLFVLRPQDGLMSAVRSPDDIGHIGAMWVSPARRGEGCGRQLLSAGLDFLEHRGCHTVELSVTDSNLPAIALYESVGFVLTGDKEPLREGSALFNLSMRLTLRG